MIDNLTTVAEIASIVLVVAAIIGGILACININVLREQHRRNTFLSLMNDLSSENGTSLKDSVPGFYLAYLAWLKQFREFNISGHLFSHAPAFETPKSNQL